jgi:murein DD-endopeptidase MepM/ murein hydrolase activator NlpD
MIIWKSHSRRRLPRSRSGQPFSRWLRPLFEKRLAKPIFGFNLALAIVIVNDLGQIGGPIPVEAPETAVLTSKTVTVLTETAFRLPLAENGGYSQGFHRFHPGVDIRVPRRTPVYPAATGTVIQVELGRFGYGHKVVISHQNQIETLYAHLDDISVKIGDQVTKDTVIGVVGMTGWTTGPHLHFEARTKEGLINPKQILPES